MAIDVKNLVAAVNPKVYCDPSKISDVEKAFKEGGWSKAAEVAKIREPDYLDIFHVMATKGAISKAGLKAPVEQHSLSYDAFSQNLEPVYFWILDFVNDLYGDSEKLIDNFVSSSGSGFFAEYSGRATRMQEEAMKIMQTVGVLMRSVIQIIYDLKEFKIRLDQYKDYNSKDPSLRRAALLGLKQIWMDNVDIRRGNGSINGLAASLDFVTIRDAFMAAESLKKIQDPVEKGGMDLNDRVKRILEQRYSEFERWIVESERELTKRFEIERAYLRSQVNSLKLYSRWAKPYFRAARQLEQNMNAGPDIVSVFNTAVFELVLLAKGKYDPARDVASGELPKSVLSEKLRKYTPCTLIEFRFRSVPERNDQRGGYTYRGKVDLKFTSFAFNEDELKVFKETLANDDFDDVFKMIEGATTDSLEQVKKDIDEFLSDAKEIKWKGEKKEEKKENKDVNPFAALFTFAEKKSKEEKKDLSKGIAKDNFWEAIVRSQAILSARMNCRKLYDTYKKSQGMPAFPPTINM